MNRFCILSLKTYFLFFLLSVLSHNGLGQSDPKSKSILEKTSSVNNSYKSIIADFSFSSINIKTNESISETGKIVLKGEKYHLSLNKSEIIFDGKDVYNYLPDANEVTITLPEPSKIEKGEFLITNPKDIFKFYTKNFKSKLVKEIDIKGRKSYEIDLYPNDLKTMYSRIRMHIDKTTYQIIDIKVFQKDGTQQLLEFSEFKTNQQIQDNELTFDQTKYPNIVVNDMRF